jgi:cell division protein FtsI (penicillin-binding protein 3)
LYEPGSTFKIVTASAALEEKVTRPTDLIDVSAGMIRLGSRVIYDDHRYPGALSFENVIVKSSNVGAIKVGLRLGPERLGLYAKRFGFGRPVSPDFPGESPGILWDSAGMSDSALASMSMGYQVGVTPLQMAAAVSSVANGGFLYEPRVVRAVIKGGKRIPVPHKLIRRTISPGTAATLTGIMEQVVERGTGRRAQLDGYTVAGKTGTAAKLVGGRYSKSDYNASFVGFVPSRKPVFAIVVVIDSPHRIGYHGGIVAAPVFQRIGDAALRLYGIPKTLNPEPPVLVAHHERTSEVQTSGPTETPAAVSPAAVFEAYAAAQSSTFPDLRGLSARDALHALAQIGLTAKLHGVGLVVEQLPEPGDPLDRDTSCRLWLERQPGSPVMAGTQP